MTTERTTPAGPPRSRVARNRIAAGIFAAWNLSNERAKDDYHSGPPTPYCYHRECPKPPTRNGFCPRHSPSATTEVAS